MLHIGRIHNHVWISSMYYGVYEEYKYFQLGQGQVPCTSIVSNHYIIA